MSAPRSNPHWPALPVASWSDTRDTLHLWTQIVGKTKLALAPPLNHWWGVTLQVTSSGLSTSLMPYAGGGVEVAFNFIDHTLTLHTTAGGQRSMRLEPRSVADFYAEYRTHLSALGVDVAIHPVPVELAEVIAFDEDTNHASYDAAATHDFWLSLVAAAEVFIRFRGEFRGKASPVHFFWGAFDLAVTRFSGRPAPDHPGGIPNCPDWVMREAYNRELSSCGYWPGGTDEGIFYSYAYPQPTGFRERVLNTPGAVFDVDLGEFVLPYSVVRRSPDPNAVLLAFLHETFDAAAELGDWPS